MRDRYPGYDVADKRWTPSWNAATRSALDKRTAVHPGARFLSAELFGVLEALCGRILPQFERENSVPIAAYLDETLYLDRRTGFRNARLPPLREAWTRGLQALDAEAKGAFARSFGALDSASQDLLIGRMARGELADPAWGDMPCELFFIDRVMAEVPRAYYAHPTAWNEIGFGGPASPRGYVRLDFDRRDPWEATEAKPGRETEARKANGRVGR